MKEDVGVVDELIDGFHGGPDAESQGVLRRVAEKVPPGDRTYAMGTRFADFDGALLRDFAFVVLVSHS